MFLDREILQPLASLKDVQLDDTELDLGRRFVLRNKTEITEVTKSPVIQSMDSVMAVIQLARTVAVSTADNESSFSCLKRILMLTPHQVSMMHERKADLILIAFKRQIAKRIHSDGNNLLRHFCFDS